MANFGELRGKRIEYIEGLEKGSDKVLFVCSDGKRYKMTHYQDWCESVSVVDVIGDPIDILNAPILVAEERINQDDDGYESATWTFYELRTIWASLTIRWLGESNGYYSESIDFDEVINE